MYCPKCKEVNSCGCEACRENRPNAVNPQIEKDELIYCPVCQFSASIDQWFAIEGEQWDEIEKQKVDK